MPPTYVSDSQDLPVEPLPAGLYLVEATDGHYKAYTLIVVGDMVLVTRTTPGSVLAFVVNRHTGEPIVGVTVKAGFGTQEISTLTTDADGLAEVHVASSKQERDNFWVIAAKGNETAIVTPASYAFSMSETSRWAAYVYTDRPVYRPGHTVHWKAVLRERVENHLEVAEGPVDPCSGE